MIRESKMRRFCNFWLILFNVRNLKPFAQFIKADEFYELKLRITARVHELLKGTEIENRGRLERCMSKISDFSLATNRQDSIPPVKTGGASQSKPRLTKKMLRDAQEVAVLHETRIGHG